jgi:hypothetical protein
MRTTTNQLICCLAIASTLQGQLMAANPVAPQLASSNKPAVAWSSGVIRINGTDYSGSGNVLPGANLETLRATGQLYLSDGTRLRLGAATRMAVQPDQLQLELGTARVEPIRTEGRTVHVKAGILDVKTAGATIQRPSPNQLIVTAAHQPAEVRKSDGLLIAMVRPGETLSFTVPDSASRSRTTQLTGLIQRQQNSYFLQDELTNVRTELRGSQPASLEGKRVRATGELVNSSSTNQRTLLVREYVLLAQAQAGTPAAGTGSGAGTSAGAATGAGAGAGTGAGAGAGAAGAGAAGAGAGAAGAGAAAAGVRVGTITTVAVVGGIALAAGVAAVAAANNDKPQEPISKP